MIVPKLFELGRVEENLKPLLSFGALIIFLRFNYVYGKLLVALSLSLNSERYCMLFSIVCSVLQSSADGIDTMKGERGGTVSRSPCVPPKMLSMFYSGRFLQLSPVMG